MELQISNLRFVCGRSDEALFYAFSHCSAVSKNTKKEAMHGLLMTQPLCFFSRHLRYLHTNMMFRYLIVRKRAAHALHLHFHTHHIHHEILICLDKIHSGLSFLLISYLPYRLFGILHVLIRFVNRIFEISSLVSERSDLN